MRLIVCAFLSCCLSSGLKAQTLPDSIQQQLDSLAVEMQEAPDSLMAALYYQSARPVYDYLALQSDSITKANWPAENLMLLKMADTLSAQSKDSLTLRKSLILLTNAYYWFKDTVQAQDYFWRYKAMCASHGYFVENGPKGEGFEYSRISHSIMIFEDSTQALSIEEISSPERQDDFRLNPFQIERYLPVRDRVIWAKIRLRSRAERDNDYFFMVGFENYSWREIEIFLPDSSGQFQRLTTGFFTPPEEKPIEDWRNYFSVFIPRKGEKTLYFRLSNPSRLGTPYNVLLYQTNREEIQAKESRNQHINGVFQGVVLVQGLFFLFWFFSTRSRVYLYYVFYLLSLALMALTVNYYLVLVPSYPDLRYIIFTVMIFIAALGFLLFSFSLLRVAERPAGKRWERILWVGFALMLVCLVLNTSANIYRYELLTQEGELYRIGYITLRIGLGFFLMLLSFAVYWSIQAIRAGQRNAIYYLIANGVFILGVGIPIMSPVLDVDWIDFKEAIYSSQLSIIIQLALFGLAVGQQQNQLEKEKRSALQESLSLQKRINEATARFVPYEFLRSLGRESILEVHLGDQVEKSVTVLFMDIRSYTTLSERMTPHENFAFLNAYLGRMGPLIKRNHGFVNQYYGDGIMAIFKGGGQDAWQATVEMQQALEHYNQEREQLQRVPIRVGIGIHSGMLMMGVIGDTERMDTGVVSDTVNTASRMEGLSKIFGTDLIVSEFTYAQLDDSAKQDCRYLGLVQVKGKDQAIGIYEGFTNPDDLRLQLKEGFQAALLDFEKGELKAAMQKWEALLAQNTADLATRFYLQRCHGAIDLNPANNWTPILRLDQKA